mmetsp:Transcript_122106/g.390527  ORF Transcript_122106/g.390527 Transcript_122106/m.390527 type:complete len:202 (-) Transcript_122106:297-902(-)
MRNNQADDASDVQNEALHLQRLGPHERVQQRRHDDAWNQGPTEQRDLALQRAASAHQGLEKGRHHTIVGDLAGWAVPRFPRNEHQKRHQHEGRGHHVREEETIFYTHAGGGQARDGRAGQKAVRDHAAQVDRDVEILEERLHALLAVGVVLIKLVGAMRDDIGLDTPCTEGDQNHSSSEIHGHILYPRQTGKRCHVCSGCV